MAAPTRELILGKARRLVAVGGRPTVAQIAQAAGVSRTTFYRAFESRDALLQALSVQPEPEARDRILEAALAMVGAAGLNALSMDDLAMRADVSRATLYRLFPGKSALFTSLIRAYSPIEPIRRLIGEVRDQPPDVVMPEIARTVYRSVYAGGQTRVGMLTAVVSEVSSFSPDAEAAAREVLGTVLATVGGYVMSQMEAGHLRRMHPLLALQMFIGPIFFHLLTRPVVERVLGFDIDGEQAVTELAMGWLRAMSVDGKENESNE